MTCPNSPFNPKGRDKWMVYPTKSKKRWVAWPKGKKKQGNIFDNWEDAVNWATMQAFVARVMTEEKL